VLSTLIFVGVLVAVAGILFFNRFIRNRNLLKEAWSGIDVQLKRRTDLIPALVETVKGYGRHEQALFTDVAKQRTQASVVADLKTLFALAESYPDLKANQNFLDLQKKSLGHRGRSSIRAPLLQRLRAEL
jgi:LemA protein